MSGFVAETPEEVQLVRLLAFRGRFRLERSGMTSKVSTLKAYNRMFGTDFSRKSQAAADCDARIQKAQESW